MLIQRLVIQLILGVVEVADTIPREDMTVAGIARRHDTVKEIHTAPDRLDDIGRCADTHQITRFVLRRIRNNLIQNVIHHFRGLSDSQTADGVARQIQLGNRLHVFDAEVVICAALIDAEQHLMRIDRIRQAVQAIQLRLTAVQPAGRALAGCLDVLVRRGILTALVKCHRNIRAEIALDAHALFRSHEDFASVDMGGEVHALLLDSAQRGQREHLKSAAVGQDRSIPIHELVQAAHLTDNLVARADMQMVGVGQLNLTAQLLQILCGNRALDGALRSDILEHRRLYGTMCTGKHAAARAAFGFYHFKHRINSSLLCCSV